MVTGNGHRQRGFRNCERAALHRDTIVRVATRRGSDRNGVGAHVLARGARHRIDRRHTVRRLVRHRGGECRIAGAIDFRLVVGLYGDGSLIDGQRTVGLVHGELIRHVIVVGVLHHGCARDGVGIGASVSPTHASCQTAYRVLMSVHREVQCLEIGSRFLRTVIIVRGAVGHHRNRVLGGAVGHLQRALILCDVVVVCGGTARQVVSERVRAAAHESLRTCHIVGGPMTGDPAITRHIDVTVGQRASVVLLGCAGGGQGDGALRNRHFAVRHLKIHGVVRVRAAELVLIQAHLICADIRS